MVIIETPVFTRLVQEILSDENYGQLQEVLRLRPEAGKLIPGSGGLRKIRWGIFGHGKRGGARIIYYLVSKGTILMLYVYPKSKREDLSVDQLKTLRKIVEEEYREKSNV